MSLRGWTRPRLSAWERSCISNCSRRLSSGSMYCTLVVRADSASLAAASVASLRPPIDPTKPIRCASTPAHTRPCCNLIHVLDALFPAVGNAPQEFPRRRDRRKLARICRSPGSKGPIERDLSPASRGRPDTVHLDTQLLQRALKRRHYREHADGARVLWWKLAKIWISRRPICSIRPRLRRCSWTTTTVCQLCDSVYGLREESAPKQTCCRRDCRPPKTRPLPRPRRSAPGAIDPQCYHAPIMPELNGRRRISPAATTMLPPESDLSFQDALGAHRNGAESFRWRLKE